MGISPGLAAYRISFELSPIILTGGIATNVPGGMLPIISITEALNFATGILSGGDDIAYEDFFAHFMPLPGSTLADNQFGTYPYANQSIAANARIKQPFTISLRMICPAKAPGGWLTKIATMNALQSALAQHDASGGTYTVMTPSYAYTNCVLLRLVETSASNDKQSQNAYQWDFWQPLLTLQDAQQAQNNLMAQISGGVPTDGSWSGLSPTVGNPASLAGPSVVPAASGAAGAQAATPSLPLPGPGPSP